LILQVAAGNILRFSGEGSFDGATIPVLSLWRIIRPLQYSGYRKS
jgi:hypothetical protein